MRQRSIDRSRESFRSDVTLFTFTGEHYNRKRDYNHETVNHSVNFVDPATGVYTQHAESNWSAAKEKFIKMKGNTNSNFLQEYLQEFMWRRWYGEPHPNGCFLTILQDIAEQYPL